MSIVNDPTDLSDEELSEAIRVLLDEQSRRAMVAAMPRQILDDIAAYQSMSGLSAKRAQKPDGTWPEWVQPTSAVDAYLEGSHVSHNGRVWLSLTPANVWEPGVSGWRAEATPDGHGDVRPADWVQPTGAHDAYGKGDRVTFHGDVWESTIDANVWEPDVYPDGWRKVEQ